MSRVGDKVTELAGYTTILKAAGIENYCCAYVQKSAENDYYAVSNN